MKAKSKSGPVRRQPQRTCIVCRGISAKRSLVRIVRAANGTGVQLDERGKMPGRGAYLCRQPSCWENALSSNALDRALNSALSGEELQALSEYASKLIGQTAKAKETSL